MALAQVLVAGTEPTRSREGATGYRLKLHSRDNWGIHAHPASTVAGVCVQPPPRTRNRTAFCAQAASNERAVHTTHRTQNSLMGQRAAHLVPCVRRLSGCLAAHRYNVGKHKIACFQSKLLTSDLFVDTCACTTAPLAVVGEEPRGPATHLQGPLLPWRAGCLRRASCPRAHDRAP